MRRATPSSEPACGAAPDMFEGSRLSEATKRKPQILAKPKPRLYVTGTFDPTSDLSLGLWACCGSLHMHITQIEFPRPSFSISRPQPIHQAGGGIRGYVCGQPLRQRHKRQAGVPQPARLERRSCRTHRRFCIRRIASPDPRPQCRRPAILRVPNLVRHVANVCRRQICPAIPRRAVVPSFNTGCALKAANTALAMFFGFVGLDFEQEELVCNVHV
jgi:hypothetical protein